MIIVCDIDNCLNDLMAKTLTLYNSCNGKNIQLSDITTYNFSGCLPKEDVDGICALFKEKELWDSLIPLPKAQKVLQQLVNEDHQVYIATATDPINFNWKCAWMESHFPFIPTDNIIRISNKGLLKCDVLIDDSMEQLINSVSERICFDYYWNRNSEKDYVYDIYRAKNHWNDVINIIRTIERKDRIWENQ